MTARKKLPRGRPKLGSGEAQSAVVNLRFRPGDRDRLEKAARKAGQTLSEWAREVLIRATT